MIDDTAVTPAHVHGLAAGRELPIIEKIATGSFRNKLLLILPVGAHELGWNLPYDIVHDLEELVADVPASAAHWRGCTTPVRRHWSGSPSVCS